MIYAALMTAGILEFIFAVILVLHFFDMEAEKEAEYNEGYADGYIDGKSDQFDMELNWTNGYIDGKSDQHAIELNRTDDYYYDALVDEANCWFGIEGD